jgi:hypothetical protein
MPDNIPLPIAIALIVTTSGFVYFLVKSWIAAKERDERELDSRFDDSYRHIDRVEEALDRRITDENTAMWRQVDSLRAEIDDLRSRKSK